MAQAKKEELPCDKCSKGTPSHVPISEEGGNQTGNSKVLGSRIMKKFYAPYGFKEIRDHPFSVQGQKKWRGEVTYSANWGDSAQAHHLICSEAMGDAGGKVLCYTFGYDVNCVENGVILPASMKIACQFGIPLHRGNHSATVTTMENKNYVDAVKALVKPLKDAALDGDACEERDELIQELHDTSDEIWEDVEAFNWTPTFRGKDFGSILGCTGNTSIGGKNGKKANKKLIPCNKEHGFIPFGEIRFLER